jgi:four helix bundle protein
MNTKMNDVQPLKQRTKAYALRIIRLYNALPRQPDAQVIGKQLLRSGTSVGANYREGQRSRSSAEMAAKFGLCVQELEESAYWMELLIESGILPEASLAELLDETYQLIAILTSSIKRIHTKC